MASAKRAAHCSNEVGPVHFEPLPAVNDKASIAPDAEKIEHCLRCPAAKVDGSLSSLRSSSQAETAVTFEDDRTDDSLPDYEDVRYSTEAPEATGGEQSHTNLTNAAEALDDDGSRATIARLQEQLEYFTGVENVCRLLRSELESYRNKPTSSWLGFAFADSSLGDKRSRSEEALALIDDFQRLKDELKLSQDRVHSLERQLQDATARADSLTLLVEGPHGRQPVADENYAASDELATLRREVKRLEGEIETLAIGFLTLTPSPTTYADT